MSQDRLDKATDLLKRINSFHVGRLDIIKSLDKKKLNSYNELMVDIYEFLQDDTKLDIYGGKNEKD